MPWKNKKINKKLLFYVPKKGCFKSITHSRIPTGISCMILLRQLLLFAFAFLSSSSIQRLVNFTHLPTISQHRLSSFIVFPLSQSMRSSLYVAKRMLSHFSLFHNMNRASNGDFSSFHCNFTQCWMCMNR